MTYKPQFPLAVAQKMATKMAVMLTEVCTRVEIAGSVRRRKETVSDVDILCIPKFGILKDKSDLFGREVSTNLLDEMLDEWIKRGWISKRLNAADQATWGAENKHAVGTATGIPIDFFITTTAHWHNTLVCKTGSAEHNIKIAAAAQERGWKWNPTGAGFSRVRGDGSTELERVTCEEEVFAFVGMKYLEPWQRD